MPSTAGRSAAIKFRGKIIVGEDHGAAVKSLYAGLSEHAAFRLYHRIADKKEPIEFGYAYGDGSEWVTLERQEPRFYMHFLM